MKTTAASKKMNRLGGKRNFINTYSLSEAGDANTICITTLQHKLNTSNMTGPPSMWQTHCFTRGQDMGNVVEVPIQILRICAQT